MWSSSQKRFGLDSTRTVRSATGRRMSACVRFPFAQVRPHMHAQVSHIRPRAQEIRVHEEMRQTHGKMWPPMQTAVFTRSKMRLVLGPSGQSDSGMRAYDSNALRSRAQKSGLHVSMSENFAMRSCLYEKVRRGEMRTVSDVDRRADLVSTRRHGENEVFGE